MNNIFPSNFDYSGLGSLPSNAPTTNVPQSPAMVLKRKQQAKQFPQRQLASSLLGNPGGMGGGPMTPEEEQTSRTYSAARNSPSLSAILSLRGLTHTPSPELLAHQNVMAGLQGDSNAITSRWRQDATTPVHIPGTGVTGLSPGQGYAPGEMDAALAKIPLGQPQLSASQQAHTKDRYPGSSVGADSLGNPMVIPMGSYNAAQAERDSAAKALAADMPRRNALAKEMRDNAQNTRDSLGRPEKSTWDMLRETQNPSVQSAAEQLGLENPDQATAADVISARDAAKRSAATPLAERNARVLARASGTPLEQIYQQRAMADVLSGQGPMNDSDYARAGMAGAVGPNWSLATGGRDIAKTNAGSAERIAAGGHAADLALGRLGAGAQTDITKLQLAASAAHDRGAFDSARQLQQLANDAATRMKSMDIQNEQKLGPLKALAGSPNPGATSDAIRELYPALFPNTPSTIRPIVNPTTGALDEKATATKILGQYPNYATDSSQLIAARAAFDKAGIDMSTYFSNNRPSLLAPLNPNFWANIGDRRKKYQDLKTLTGQNFWLDQ